MDVLKTSSKEMLLIQKKPSIKFGQLVEITGGTMGHFYGKLGVI